MKILIDCRFWGTKNTGLGRYTQNLVENLLKIDKKNDYVLLFQKNNKPTSYQLPATSYLINAPHYSFKEQLFFPSVIKKINPDLIHFPHFNVPVLSQYPFVVTIHDLIKHHFKGTETTTRQALIYYLKYWAYQQVFAQAIKKSKKIIVPSQFVKKQILKFYSLPQSKIKVVYEGISIHTDNKSLIINHKPFFLYVGNAYSHKNLDRLILAMKKVNTSIINHKLSTINHYSLIIVSPRDVFYKRLQKSIDRFQAKDFVKLLGHVSDEKLKKLYGRALAFISPSLMEGFGLPGLEAMAVGCPVICSQINTFKEIYDQAALYFDPKNIDDMSEKIKKMINFSSSQRQQLISKGKKQAAKYSWQKCAKETLKIYNSL